MKKIIVTPGGRERYLSILLKHLIKQRNDFDEWVIWVNTTNEDDINYMKKIESEFDFIKLEYLTIPHAGNLSIHSFFKNCIDPNSLYLRLDDDVIYIKKDSIKKIFKYRETNTENFLVYGNIINNAVLSHLHQRKGLYKTDKLFGYKCMDENGWDNPKLAELIHETFFEKYSLGQLDDFQINNWILHFYERVSINVICFRGDEFLKFNGEVGIDEEQWLSCDKPRNIERPNIIFGDCLFVHYGFYTQRTHLDTTNILEKYKILY